MKSVLEYARAGVSPEYADGLEIEFAKNTIRVSKFRNDAANKQDSRAFRPFLPIFGPNNLLGDVKCAPVTNLVNDAPRGTLAYCAPGIT